MTKLISNSFTLFSVLVFCGLSAISQAQNDGRWYKVELLIVSHNGSASTEQWEASPNLVYPGAARFLVYPEQVASRLEEHGGTSEMDEFGRQFLRNPVEEPGAAIDIPRQEQPAPAAPNNIEGVALATELVLPTPLLPTPFIVLPSSEREFHGKAAYMQRSGHYQKLFHETWVQPFRDERNALPLVIDHSGDNGTWPLLQGSINLHISRYLHIETNLWLNTNGDYLPGEWRMAAPPLGPVSLIVEEPEPDPAQAQAPYYLDEKPGLSTDEVIAQGEQVIEDTGPIYPYRHAVLLKQNRRMRSNEVHYIDHPLLGVIIKITPLDDEALLTMAEAEAAASPAAQ